MKIVVFSADPGNHRFIQPLIDIWRKDGHEVQLLNNYSPTEADVYWFDFVDNNLITATRDYAQDLKGKRVIARLHAVEYYVGHYKSVDWEKVNTLIFVSEHMRRKVGQLPVETVVIPNGIDLARFTYRERVPGFTLGYAGNIVPTKGILQMFQYLKLLVNRDPRWNLKMIGLNRFHGREGEFYAHYLKVTGLKNHVAESGEVPDTNVWLDGIDYLWQPSLAESFSIIVGEAMAKGIKPLINCFDGSTEIWPPELVYDDFDSFYRILNSSYDSIVYRQYVEKYSLTKQAESIYAVIQAK